MNLTPTSTLPSVSYIEYREKNESKGIHQLLKLSSNSEATPIGPSCGREGQKRWKGSTSLERYEASHLSDAIIGVKYMSLRECREENKVWGEKAEWSIYARE